MSSTSREHSLILILTLKLALDCTLYVEGFQIGGVNRIKHVNQTAGGKGINVARALFSLGWVNLISIGVVGGPSGREIVTRLNDENIPGDYLQGIHPSSIDYIIRDSHTSQDTALYDMGQELLPQEIKDLKKKFLSILPKAKLAILSGKSPCTESDPFFKWAAEVSRNYDVPCIVDTSGDSLKQAIQARPLMIKPNAQEVQQLFDWPCLELSDRIQAARELCRKGIEWVVISAGEKEVVVGFREEVWVAKPPELFSGSTVGCGDAMVAGFSLGFVEGMSKEEHIRFGIACGSANIHAQKTGGLHRNRVEKLMQELDIWKV